MILAWTNRADTGIVSASSEISTLPGSNVQNKHLSKKWQTAAAVKSASLVIDLGSSLACALLGVFGTNLTSAATVRLRGSDSDSTGVTGEKYDSTLIASGVSTGIGDLYLSFTSAAARYWRVDLADASVSDNLQIGRVFLGPKWTLLKNQLFGWSMTAKDPSNVKKSKGGQTHAEVLPQTRILQFTLAFQSEAQMYGNGFVMARAQGIVKDIVALNDLSATYPTEQSVFGLVDSSQPIINDNYGIFRQQFTVEQRL